jgi:hypothetical protein
MPTKYISSITQDQTSNANRMCQELGINREHFEQIKAFVLQTWWPDLCRGANGTRFWVRISEVQVVDPDAPVRMCTLCSQPTASYPIPGILDFY